MTEHNKPQKVTFIAELLHWIISDCAECGHEQQVWLL